MDYRVWVEYEGATEEDDTFDDVDERDARAEALELELRKKPDCWQFWILYVANVATGCTFDELPAEACHVATA